MKRYWKVLSVCALTYDLNLLDDGDNTIVGDNGINLSKGQKARINLARACYKESDIYLLDDCLTALDAKVNKYVFNECIKGFLRDKIVVFVSHNVHHIKQADHTVIIDEGSTLNIQRQKDLLEKRITYYIDDVEENHFEGEKDIITDNETDKLLIEQQNKTAKNIYQEQSASGTVKCGTYKKYYEFSGGIFALIWTFVLFFGAQGASSYSEMLLSKWVNLEAEIASFRNKNISTETNSTYASKVSEHDEIQKWYSIMIIVVSVLMFLRIYFCFLYCTYASHRLHNTMLHSILHSCMAFFDTNFIGNILNRFTKDLAAIDEYLPYLVYENFKLVFVIGGIIFLIASVNKAFLIPAAVIFVILYFIRKFYLNTGRSLKRLEATTRSPMIGYLNASLDGLTTIRAYELEPTIRKEFDRHLDLFTSAFYMLLCATRAFGFILDMICTLFITTIILKFLYSENDASAGNVGMAITQSFMLTGLFQWAIRQWAELESSMTSVERVLEYTSLKAENKTGLTYDNWPTHGGIVYENVNLVYTTTKEHVLKDINFIIKPREKIGIVGRTGAGKSSIISTLFRLYDIEGKILIDDVDIKTVSLDFLRSNIAIIPQDPILFSGSIRSNIDPTGKNTDMEIWKAIQTVKLNTLVNTLDQSISDSGTQYSAGQRQLICLARALVTRNKIIVLDEATANMDPETDQLLHNSLKENFSDCTVLTIAHRLNSVINSDRVMVVDDGRIVEFDRPDVLLADNSGAFYQVAKQAGIV